MSDPLNAPWYAKALLVLPMAALAFGPIHFMHAETARQG